MGSPAVQQGSDYCSDTGDSGGKKYIEWGADLVFPHPSVSLINTYLYALLRRSDIAWNTGRKREKQEMIQKGKLLIDWRYHTAYWGERELTTLNEREKAFLYLLADSSRQVVTHEIIFEKLWKEPYGDDSANMIWCFVRRLRKNWKRQNRRLQRLFRVYERWDII